jgi:uncharacterized protein
VKPRITVLAIGVNDLKEPLRFYRVGLGLKTEGIIGEEFEYEAVGFFDLQNGVRLALWPQESLAHDIVTAGVTNAGASCCLIGSVLRKGDGLETHEQSDCRYPYRLLLKYSVIFERGFESRDRLLR